MKLYSYCLRWDDGAAPNAHKQQGHKVKANQSFAEQFVQWIDDSSYEVNKLYGEPQLKSEFELGTDIRSKCAERDLEDDDHEICQGC